MKQKAGKGSARINLFGVNEGKKKKKRKKKKKKRICQTHWSESGFGKENFEKDKTFTIIDPSQIHRDPRCGVG